MAWVTKSSSESYENLKEPERVYTPAEKLANWWHYYKWAVLIVLIVLGITGWIAYSVLSQKTPDYQVAWVASYDLPTETVTALQDRLEGYAIDRNRDGETYVQVNRYVIDFDEAETSESADPSMAAYSRIAGMTRLSADLSEGMSYIFIIEDPENFLRATECLQYLDGTTPAEGAKDWQNMVYRWTDCPVLTGFDLGQYENTLTGEPEESAQLFEGVYVARRGAWTEEQQEENTHYDGMWELLTKEAQPMGESDR